MRLIALLILIFSSGCATGFKEASQDSTFGYKIRPVKAQNSFYNEMSSYIGNTSTGKSSARVYAQYAAVQHCIKENKVAILANDIDFSKTYQSVESGWNGTNAYSYNTYKTMPAYMVLFRCDDKFLISPQLLKTNIIKAELIKDYVSDFKGAIQVKTLRSAGPLKENDVVLEVDGKRVVNFMNLLNYFAETEGVSAKLKLIRDKKIISKNVILFDGLVAAKVIQENVKYEFCVVENDGLEEECRRKFKRTLNPQI